MKKRFVYGLLIVLLLTVPGVYAQDDTKMPPQSYSEVEGQYTALETEAVTQSEEVVDLFLTGDITTLYGRLTPDFQALVTQEQIEQAYQQLTAVAPIGERIDYRLMSAGGSSAYMAVHTWGDQQITLAVAINADGAISGLNLQPVTQLPDDPAAGYHSAVSFRLPFDGLWYVAWGGDDELHNYHVVAAPQRHAYDFLVWKDGSTFTGDGTKPEDYYAYGQPVLAPADGTVITVVDGLPDQVPQTGSDPAHAAGNHVVIQVAEQEYLFIAHMQPGSIQVKEGDVVTAGQIIGRCGNSGNTSEPHIHIHLQDQPQMFTTDESGAITGMTDAIGLPLEFSNMLVNGEPVAIGEPLGGQFAQQGD